MALDERAAAPPDGRSREDEVAALTAQLRGMLLRGFGTLTMILVAVLGFFGTHLWTTVDRHTEQLAALSASVATLNVNVGALRERLDLSVGKLGERLDLSVGKLGERLDLSVGELRERMDLNVAGLRERMDLDAAALRERMDLQFATLTKDVERTRSEIERTRSELLQAVAGSKRPGTR